MFEAPQLPYSPEALAAHGFSAEGLTLHLSYQRACYQRLVAELARARRRAGEQVEGEVMHPELVELPEGLWTEQYGDLGVSPESIQALEKVIQNERGPVQIAASQVWAHQLLWASMRPTEEQLEGELSRAIQESFGGLEELKARARSLADAQLGAAWLYLCARDDGALRLIACVNSDTPVSRSQLYPLLCCDLWQHAYQLDSPATVEGQLERWWRAVNWPFAAQRYAALLSRVAQEAEEAPHSSPLD